MPEERSIETRNLPQTTLPETQEGCYFMPPASTPPPGVRLIQDTIPRAPGTNIEGERRMELPAGDYADLTDLTDQCAFPQIYCTRTSREVIQGNLSHFIGEKMNAQTMDRITHIVERMVMSAGNTLPEFQGRGFRTVAPGSTRLMLPAYEDLPEQTDDNDVIQAVVQLVKVRNLVPPPCARDIGTSSFVRGYEWDPTTGNLRVDLQTEAYEVMRSVEESPFSETFNGTTDAKWKTYLKKEAFRQKMRCNLVIKSKTRGGFINGVAPEELTAIDTLRELITEKEFRKYMRYGFLLVEGDSGDLYQIFRDQWHVKVWRKGILVEEVCVNLDSSFKVPPTDKVVGFLAMIHASETEFKKLGNVYKMLGKVA